MRNSGRNWHTERKKEEFPGARNIVRLIVPRNDRRVTHPIGRLVARCWRAPPVGTTCRLRGRMYRAYTRAITQLYRYDWDNGHSGGLALFQAKEFCCAADDDVPYRSARRHCRRCFRPYCRCYWTPLWFPFVHSTISPSRSGIIIRSVGNVTVIHAEKLCLLEQRSTTLRWSGAQGWPGHPTQEIVTYGGFEGFIRSRC